MADNTLLDTTTQEFIDDLISVIWTAEERESVTNEMVARVLDFLNRRKQQLAQGRGDSEEVAMSQKAVSDELVALQEAVKAEAEAREKADAAILGTVDIGDLDSLTVAQGIASVVGTGPHRYVVTDDGKVVGSLDVIGDEMLHVFTQVLTTHRLIDSDGKLTATHRDDRVYTYYRSMGLRNGGIPEGEWTRWRRMGGAGGGTEMAIEVDPVTGEVSLLYDDDGEVPFSDAYINERGEIVMEMELTNN